MLLALLPLAVAEPARVGPGTGDHPVRDRGAAVEWCVRDVEVRPFYPDGPRPPRPRHARAHFGAEIADSARRALPVEHVEAEGDAAAGTP